MAFPPPGPSEAAGSRVADLCAAARCCLDHLDGEGAVARATEALQEDGTCALAYRLRGRGRHLQNDQAGALADLDRAVELDPDNPSAYLDRAVVYEAREEYGRAVAELDKVIPLAPGRAEIYQHRARLKQARGDLAGARADLDKAIRLQPDNPSLYPLRADVREKQDDLFGALADWDRAFQLIPQPGPLDHCHRARVRRKCWDLRGALAELDSALSLHPDCASLFQERGEVKAELGDDIDADADRAEARRLEEREWQQQDETLARVIAENPTSPDPLVERASALLARHRSALEDAEPGTGATASDPLLAQALADLDLALRLDPGCLRAYQVRAEIRLEVGDFLGALADLNELIRRGAPPKPRNYLQRARVHSSLGQLDAAIDDLREGIRRDYHDVAELHGDLANLLRDKDDETGAVAVEADGMRAKLEATRGGGLHGTAREIHGDLALVLADYDQAGHPDVPEAAYYRRGLMRHLEGNPDVAMEDYEKAIRANRQYAPAYRGRGVVKRERGEFEEAIVDLDQALLLQPIYPLALYHRGNARQAHRELTTALADYDRALDLEPGMVCARLARGSVFEARGSLAGALADYEETLTLDPEDEVASCGRGRVRRALGQLDQAVSDFDAALERDPTYTNAFLARRAVRIQLDGAPLAHAFPYLLGASLGGALLGLGLGWVADLAGSALRDDQGAFPWLPAGGAVGGLLWLLTVTLVVPLMARVGLFADAPAVARVLVADPRGRPGRFDWYSAVALLYGLSILVLAWVFPFWVALLALCVPLLVRLSVLHGRNSEVKMGGIAQVSFLLLCYLTWLMRDQLLGLLQAGLLGAVAGGLSGWVLGGTVGALAGRLVPGRCGRSLLGYYLEREQASGDALGPAREMLRTLGGTLYLTLSRGPVQRRIPHQVSTSGQWTRRAGSVVLGGTGMTVGFLAAALAWHLPASDPLVWALAGTGLALVVAWLQGRRLVLTPRPDTSGGPGYVWQHLNLAGLLLAGVVGAGLGYLAWSLHHLLGGVGPGQAGWPAYWALTGGGAGAVGGLRLWAMLDR